MEPCVHDFIGRWREFLIGLFEKRVCSNIFSESGMFKINLHPYRMCLKVEGCSHGL